VFSAGIVDTAASSGAAGKAIGEAAGKASGEAVGGSARNVVGLLAVPFSVIWANVPALNTTAELPFIVRRLEPLVSVTMFFNVLPQYTLFRFAFETFICVTVVNGTLTVGPLPFVGTVGAAPIVRLI